MTSGVPVPPTSTLFVAELDRVFVVRALELDELVMVDALTKGGHWKDCGDLV